MRDETWEQISTAEKEKCNWTQEIHAPFGQEDDMRRALSANAKIAPRSLKIRGEKVNAEWQ
ncbi:hypothetical protein PsorP6_014557 [Peronosclerospora sorghi]|uniref:Uncharacterized protein n=1 Tax=Peronosclerospora sorghi TaxID=230839 RepID=A0ACC0VQW6_9STRA|nr:hypothetical protein PsorP6_014557 [Peronosclerospora sorghi]